MKSKSSSGALATLQLLSSHLWLVATIADNAGKNIFIAAEPSIGQQGCSYTDMQQYRSQSS